MFKLCLQIVELTTKCKRFDFLLYKYDAKLFISQKNPLDLGARRLFLKVFCTNGINCKSIKSPLRLNLAVLILINKHCYKLR